MPRLKYFAYKAEWTVRKTIVLAVKIAIGLATLAAIIFLPALLLDRNHQEFIYSGLDDVEPVETAIVFGAGVDDDGTPSLYLQDRLDTAVEIYRTGIIEEILVTGDNSKRHNYETDVMRDYLVENGVPEDTIREDPEGSRTFVSCKRANEEYTIEETLLITQDFHLPRALYVCRFNGIEVMGLSATKRTYTSQTFYQIRESLAVHRALIDMGTVSVKEDIARMREEASTP